MQVKIKNQILDAFFVVLRPIAKILLRYGIGYREFAEVAKSAFVEVASSEYGIRGRPTNISRIAVMTGLTRKEVRRLRDLRDSGSHSPVTKPTPLATILNRWNSEEDFLDNEGRPAVLQFSGPGNTFSELVRRFGGDIPPGAMRTELKRVKAIVEVEDGGLKAIRREVYPRVEHEYLTMALLHGAYPILENIAHNNNPEKTESTWAQMTAFSGCISKTDILRIRRICADRAQESAESYDNLLSGFERRQDECEGKPDCIPVAVGVFYFEERDTELRRVWKNT